MSDGLITINRRFVINKTRHEVFDKESRQKTRVEPRLIKLLCMLAGNPKTVMTRSRIIHEIWNDYPGANESLNQAISFLRKILLDTNKELLQTIPKKGYVFNGIATKGQESAFIGSNKIRRSLSVVHMLLLTVLFASGWFALVVRRLSATPASRDHDQKKLSEVYRLDASRTTKKLHCEPGQRSVPFERANEKNLAELARIDMINQAKNTRSDQGSLPK